MGGGAKPKSQDHIYRKKGSTRSFSGREEGTKHLGGREWDVKGKTGAEVRKVDPLTCGEEGVNVYIGRKAHGQRSGKKRKKR